MRGQVDLDRVSVAAIVCAIVAAVVPWEVVRVIAALPLAFFLPGYAITAAAFGRRHLDRPQLLMLSLALSLTVLTLGGLLLNYVGGLRTITWAILIVVVVIAGSYTAATRRESEHWRLPVLPRPRRADALLGGLAVLVAVGALILAYTPLPAGDATGYTSLWMLPARAGGLPALRVGTESSEQGAVGLRLEVRSAGRLLARHGFSLDPGEKRLFRIPLEGAGSPRRHVVVASLFREADPHTLYRRVTRWVGGERTGA